MKFQSFKNWINEQFSNPLFEIGEATAKPYSTTSVNGDYGFETEDGDKYYVNFELIERNNGAILAYVSFYSSNTGEINDEDMNRIINKGRMFRIMATVVQSIKDYIKKYEKKYNMGFILDPLEYIGIIPAKNGANDNRRLNIYRAYIRKLLPDAKIIKRSEIIEHKHYDTLIIKVSDIKKIL